MDKSNVTDAKITINIVADADVIDTDLLFIFMLVFFLAFISLQLLPYFFI